MKDLIKEVALSVWASQESAADTRSGDQIITEFATAFLAELSKRAEAVAYWQYRTFYEDNTSTPGWSEWETFEPCGLLSVEDQVEDLRVYISRGCKYEIRQLFTFPPIHDIEAIENRVSEACAKACIKEAVQIVIDGPEERAYNNATSDCAEAIRSGEWRKYK